MNKTFLALSLGLGIAAAPALQACDMHKADEAMNLKPAEKTSVKEAKAAKSTKAKAAQKTAEKKSSTTKI